MYNHTREGFIQSLHRFMESPEFWRSAMGTHPKYFLHCQENDRHLFGLSKFCVLQGFTLQEYIERRPGHGSTAQKQIVLALGERWRPLRQVAEPIQKEFKKWFFGFFGSDYDLSNISIISLGRARAGVKNRWMTTHWPPNEDDATDYEPEGVYLPEGRQIAGADLAVGDLVLIYQSLTGRSQIGLVKGKETAIRSVEGKRGIIAIVQVTSSLKEIPGSKPTSYVDGSEIWWRWHADTDIVSTNGFVPLSEVNRVLGYSPNNNLHGFGDYKSGLKKLSKNEFDRLVAIFKKHPRRIEPLRRAKRKGFGIPHEGRGEETAEHRALKEYVASNPSLALGEPGLRTIRMEYRFPTNDRADIILEDAMGRIIGAEIEVAVDGSQVEGVLQAIKYRYMGALMHERRYAETRAFLIAHSMDEDIRQICHEYEVECFLVDQASL